MSTNMTTRKHRKPAAARTAYGCQKILIYWTKLLAEYFARQIDHDMLMGIYTPDRSAPPSAKPKRKKERR